MTFNALIPGKKAQLIKGYKILVANPLCFLFQLQNVASKSGNGDECYYNYLCKARFWIFEDYGAVYSNISYILSGIFFLGIVTIR